MLEKFCLRISMLASPKVGFFFLLNNDFFFFFPKLRLLSSLYKDNDQRFLKLLEFLAFYHGGINVGHLERENPGNSFSKSAVHLSSAKQT